MNEYLKRLGSFILDILQTVVMAVAIFMVVYLFLMRPHQVSGRSMVPNLQDGEYLLTEKVSYWRSEPKRGDVVVFSAPPTRRQDYIKRVIGVPGDQVEIKDGKVLVNGKLLDEAYLPSEFKTDQGRAIQTGRVYTLGADEYFVFGDNRGNSSDSRDFGPIKGSDIVGKAWVVYWPPQEAGVVPGVSYAGF